MRLRMAVERKDRFLELLRDQNDDLKAKISKLQGSLKTNIGDEKTHQRMFLVKELPLASNRTV